MRFPFYRSESNSTLKMIIFNINQIHIFMLSVRLQAQLHYKIQAIANQMKKHVSVGLEKSYMQSFLLFLSGIMAPCTHQNKNLP